MCVLFRLNCNDNIVNRVFGIGYICICFGFGVTQLNGPPAFCPACTSRYVDIEVFMYDIISEFNFDIYDTSTKKIVIILFFPMNFIYFFLIL